MLLYEAIQTRSWEDISRTMHVWQSALFNLDCASFLAWYFVKWIATGEFLKHEATSREERTVFLAMLTSHDSILVSVKLRLVRNKLTKSGFLLNCLNPLDNYTHHLALQNICYMASSVSGQDEPNRSLWLATHLGLPAVSRKKFRQSQTINPLLTKLARPRWLDIDLILFCEFRLSL